MLVLNVTANHVASDCEVANLQRALQEARTVSHKKILCIAILGEQGIGKSSLLCSIFDRQLVDISADLKACTAFPTIITYKKGTSDDTMESDVLIQCHDDEGIREGSMEHARRYRFAHPRRSRSDDESNSIYFDEYHDHDEEEQEDESDAERTDILAGARTAKEFFEIIFNAEGNRERERALQDRLLYEDIESGHFADTCVRNAKERLVTIGAQNGSILHSAISDEELEDMRIELKKIWPLVKAVRLSTGHRMLKNNLSFIDLPGYGDDNQIRTAVVEKLREMADFEIVVAPAKRSLSNVTQDKYLNRSIRRLGARKTLLLLNRSDDLLHDLVEQGVNKIKDPPFPEAKRRLKESEQVLKIRSEDRSLVQDYRRTVLISSATDYLRRKEEHIRVQLPKKGIKVDVLLVSARHYSLCLDTYSCEPPQMTPEATGVPQLRRYLLELPARMNYETLQYHVWETLPDISSQIERILTKFVEDVVYAEMRKDLEPWTSDSTEEEAILAGFKGYVYSFSHPVPYYATYLKMIKENGIPVNGKAKGRNMNNELQLYMIDYIVDWHENTLQRIPGLVTGMKAPVHNVLRQLRSHLANLTHHPELKRRAEEALEARARRIGMAEDKLKADFEERLRATYDCYANETHVYSPVALAMRPIYHSVLDVIGGPGAYRRHRDHLYECLCRPRAPRKNFAKVIAEQIAKAQRESWTVCCNEYASEAMAQLTEFQQIADELLDSGGYVKADHRMIRDQLQALLPASKESLQQIQKACPRLELVNPDVSEADSLNADLVDGPPSAKRRRVIE